MVDGAENQAYIETLITSGCGFKKTKDMKPILVNAEKGKGKGNGSSEACGSDQTPTGMKRELDAQSTELGPKKVLNPNKK